MKKRVIVDLDIVTVALWDKRGESTKLAKEFINRIKKGEFYIATPFFLIEIVLNWKNEPLKREIKEFYVKNSDNFFTDTEIKEKCNALSVDYENVLNKLESEGIKREDATLVLIASLYAFDYLVTFNRIHLRNKKKEVNEALRKCNLPTIWIVGPEEI